MRLGVMLGYFGAGTTAAEQLEASREAERAGYDSAWVAEAYGSDAATVLAWLAAQTSTIKLGSAVFQIPALHRLPGRTITLVTPGLVRRAHDLGKHVHVWFHSWSREDAAEMHRLLDLGADGIVTDHIDVLRDVLAERGHPLTPPG